MLPALTAQQTFEMLENQSLWELAERVHRLLTDRGIDYAIVGGMAVCLHGYRRNTVGLDLLLRPEFSADARSQFEADRFVWSANDREFRSSSGLPIQLVLTGDKEGPGQPATFPDPSNAEVVTRIEGLNVLSLAELIQSKLACGLGDLRRTHKDFADVVELIAFHRLDGSFARKLHESVRAEFRELVQRVEESN